MDKQTLALEAQALTKNEALEVIFGRLEQKYFESWKATKPDQEDARAHLYKMVTSINALKSEISSEANALRVSAFNQGVR